MKRLFLFVSIYFLLFFGNANAAIFMSGSTGADGVFNPVTNTELQLPANGIFNFTTVNIPSGVTVTFKKNAANTPVYILTTGDVTIAGAINVSGGSTSSSTGRTPANGGPGGYDGGYGGILGQSGGAGGKGLGRAEVEAVQIAVVLLAAAGFWGGNGGSFSKLYCWCRWINLWKRKTHTAYWWVGWGGCAVYYLCSSTVGAGGGGGEVLYL